MTLSHFHRIGTGSRRMTTQSRWTSNDKLWLGWMLSIFQTWASPNPFCPCLIFRIFFRCICWARNTGWNLGKAPLAPAWHWLITPSPWHASYEGTDFLRFPHAMFCGPTKITKSWTCFRSELILEVLEPVQIRSLISFDAIWQCFQKFGCLTSGSPSQRWVIRTRAFLWRWSDKVRTRHLHPKILHCF